RPFPDPPRRMGVRARLLVDPPVDDRLPRGLPVPGRRLWRALDRDVPDLLAGRRVGAARSPPGHRRAERVPRGQGVVPRSRRVASSRERRRTRMTSDARATLSARALRVRERIIRMSAGGGCFIGASLSCADLLVFLYGSVLNVTPETRTRRDRDYLFLSKGHDVPALYGTLAEFGFVDDKRLAHHMSPCDEIYWHPNRAVAVGGLHAGWLGHLPAVALGVAMDIQMSGGSNRVFVIVGDGELNEGSVWEAALVAAARKLDNLVLIVDRNEFQANMRTEDLVPLEPIEAKFAA